MPCPMLIDQAQGDLRIASGKSYSRKRRDEASDVSASRSPDADAADFASRKSQLRRERPPTLLPEKRAGEACSGLRVGLAVDACQVALHHA